MKILKTILISALVCGAAQAATVVQTKTYTFSASLNGSGSVPPNASGIALTVDPFDASLGTLESFTISWAPATVTFTGVVNPTGGNGSLSGGLGGTLSIDGAGYGGRSNGSGASGGANASLDASFTLSATSDTFLVSGAGTTYNPAYLASVRDSTPFDISLSNTASYSYTNLASGLISVSMPLTVTYTYTPVPEPSAAVLGGLGALALLRRRKR